jgi:opacity protein-like surface antigen
VHKSPSTGSPVLGRAQRGAQLEVTREVGDWVKVVWMYTSDGKPVEEGYVHLSMGVLSRNGSEITAAAAALAAEAPSAPHPAPARASEPTVQSRRLPPGRAGALAEPSPVYVNRPTHIVGVGGLMNGATIGFGATMRAWPMERLGVQFGLSRTSTTSATMPGTMTATEFAPSALYSITDRVTDYVWFRPYVGSGVTFVREKLTITPDAVSSNANTFGLRVFGGAELSLAAVPRLGVSADVGYRWAETSFSGFDTRGFGFSISAHWYVK